MTLQTARSDKKKRDEMPQMPKQRPQQSRGDFLWELRPKESPHYSRDLQLLEGPMQGKRAHLGPPLEQVKREGRSRERMFYRLTKRPFPSLVLLRGRRGVRRKKVNGEKGVVCLCFLLPESLFQ